MMRAVVESLSWASLLYTESSSKHGNRSLVFSKFRWPNIFTAIFILD